MRPPLSAIEPDSVGVSIRTRGEARSASSRLLVWAGTVPGGAGGAVPGGAGAPGCCGAPGAGCDCGCACFCFSSCGMPKKICHPIRTSAESTIAMSVFFWSLFMGKLVAAAARG